MANAKSSVTAVAALVIFLANGCLALAAEEWPSNHQPRLEVTQNVVDQAGPGKPFFLDLCVRNLGTVAAQSLRITDKLPDGAELLEASPFPSRQQNLLVWSLATLNAGEECRIRLRVRAGNIPPTPEWLNKIRITYHTEVGQVCPIDLKRPKLELAVAASKYALLGEVIPLTITLRNTGTWPGHKVNLTALLSGGLSHESGMELENEIGTLPPGQSATISLPVKAQQLGKGCVQLRLTAEEVGDLSQNLPIDIHDVRVNLDIHGPNTASADWPCTYNFVLSNQGREVLPASKLVAQLPKGLAVVRTSGNGIYEPRSHTVTWESPECKPGESLTYVLGSIARDGADGDGCLKVIHHNHTIKEVPWNFHFLDRPSSVSPLSQTTNPMQETGQIKRTAYGH